MISAWDGNVIGKEKKKVLKDFLKVNQHMITKKRRGIFEYTL